MAATVALVSGINTFVQNQVYATPGKTKFCRSDTVLEVSNAVAGSFTAVAATTTGTLLGGSLFVRCTTAAAVVAITNQ